MIERLLTPAGFLAAITTVAVLCIGPVIIQLLRTTPRLGWRVALLSVAAASPLAVRIATIGPADVSLGDLVTGVLLVAATLRNIDRRSWNVPILVLAGVYGLGLIRSFHSFGLGGADLSFREELAVVAGVLYGASLAPEHLEPLLVDIRRLAFVYCGLAVAVWAGLVDGIHPGVTDFASTRAVPAVAAMTMAIALLYSLWGWLTFRAGAVHARAMALLGLFVLLTRHRSVWVAALVGLASLLLVHQSLRLRRSVVLGSAVLAGLLIIAIGPQSLGGVGDALETSASDTRTWEWRVDRWDAIWSEHWERGPTTLLVGTPYGVPWLRSEGAASVGPHNYYVQLAVRLGVVGLAAFLALYVKTQVRAVRRAAPESALLVAVLTAQLAYFVSYSSNVILGTILGGCVANVASRPSRVHGSGVGSVSVGADRARQELPAR